MAEPGKRMARSERRFGSGPPPGRENSSSTVVSSARARRSATAVFGTYVPASIALLHDGGTGQEDGSLRAQIWLWLPAGERKQFFHSRIQRPRQTQRDGRIRLWKNCFLS